MSINLSKDKATFEEKTKQIGFSEKIKQLIEEKFNFSSAELAKERKPKADKGV